MYRHVCMFQLQSDAPAPTHRSPATPGSRLPGDCGGHRAGPGGGPGRGYHEESPQNLRWDLRRHVNVARV